MGDLGEPQANQGVALREAKLALRRRILSARDALPPSERASATAAITARLASLATFVAAARPLLTLSFRSEFDTSGLIAAALAASKEIVFPRVDHETRMLRLHRVRDLATDIAPGYLGIPEPRASCADFDPRDVDWVLVPGVAFDRRGGRLGYGGGFYDRLLPLIPATAPRVAGAYALQIVDAVPRAPHDLELDAIVTESETLVRRR